MLAKLLVAVITLGFPSLLYSQGNPAAGLEGASTTNAPKKINKQAGTGRAAVERDREQAKRLLLSLEDVLLRTDKAGGRIKRVQEIIEALKKYGKNESRSDVVILATEDLIATLKNSLDQLQRDAVIIRDRVRNEVIPEYGATTAKMMVRLEVLETVDPNYVEVQKIVDKAVENQSRLNSQVTRLDLNIKMLGQMRADLVDKLSIFMLWKQVNLKGEELMEKMDEFNKQLEEIYNRLYPNPS